jgi:hypothetical protein
MNIKRRLAVTAFRRLAVTAFMALLSVSAIAQPACLQWGFGKDGWLTLSQSNKVDAGLILKLTGSNFTGSGHFLNITKNSNLIGPDTFDTDLINGTVVGTIKGNAFEATIFWSNKSVGIYTGQVGPQGLIIGNTYDKNNPATRADFNSTEPLICLARAKNLGREKSTAPPASKPTSICDAAKSARARNSPAAPGLEKQCAELTKKPVGHLGRVKTNPSDPKPPICDAAQSARARNSPAAPGLERQCNEYLRTHPDQPSGIYPDNQGNAVPFNPPVNDSQPSQQSSPFLQNPNTYNQDNGYYQNNSGYPYNQNGQGSQGVNSVPVPRGALQR